MQATFKTKHPFRLDGNVIQIFAQNNLSENRHSKQEKKRQIKSKLWSGDTTKIIWIEEYVLMEDFVTITIKVIGYFSFAT